MTPEIPPPPPRARAAAVAAALLGLASVGNDAEKHASHLRALDNQDAVVFFCRVLCFGGNRDVGQFRSYCAGWRAFTPRKGVRYHVVCA